MQQSDYILREIEKISSMIMGLLGKMIRKNSEEQLLNEQAYNEAVQEFNSVSSLYFDQLLGVQPDDFNHFFLRSKGYDDHNVEQIAELLLNMGQISDVKRKNLLLEKSLQIYQYLDASQKTYSIERVSRIHQIKTLLNSS